jgi:hypothetical protein
VITGLAFCPHPPLLFPELAVGAAGDTEALRMACDGAIRAVLATRPELVVLIGTGPTTGPLPGTASGTLSGFGVEVTVPLDPAAIGGTGGLPLSLTVGAWLLTRADWPGDRTAVTVAADASAAQCQALGEGLAAGPRRTAMLVLGDGSITRTERAPGSLDPDGEVFDAEVATALRHADLAGLAALDPARAASLGAVGRAPWQVASAAAAAQGRAWTSSVWSDEAPFGVGYLVASWI